MPKKTPPVARPNGRAAAKIAEEILNFVGRIPITTKREAREPSAAARELARAAAAKAALTSGSLALPPGPLGLLTLIPDLIAVWKIQAQMVADIAAIYGKKAFLNREQMLYCLFRHLASQALRDLVVRVGERVLIRRASLRLLQTLAQKIGIRITQRVIGKGVSRWLPIVGALGVGVYAYLDTGQVAATTIELFEQELGIEPKRNEDV